MNRIIPQESITESTPLLADSKVQRKTFLCYIRSSNHWRNIKVRYCSGTSHVYQLSFLLFRATNHWIWGLKHNIHLLHPDSITTYLQYNCVPINNLFYLDVLSAILNTVGIIYNFKQKFMYFPCWDLTVQFCAMR